MDQTTPKFEHKDFLGKMKSKFNHELDEQKEKQINQITQDMKNSIPSDYLHLPIQKSYDVFHNIAKQIMPFSITYSNGSQAHFLLVEVGEGKL